MKEHQKENIKSPVPLKALLKEARKKQTCAERREIKSILQKMRKTWKKVKSPNGKTVRVSPERMQSERSRELQPELQHAFVFADRGCKVYLPKEEHTKEGQKSFDAIINGIKFEFKYIGSGSARSAERSYGRGLEQSQNISFYISKDTPSKKDEFIRRFKQAAKSHGKKANILIIYFQIDDTLECIDFSNTER